MSQTMLLNREEQVFAYMAVALGGGLRQAAVACRRSRADVVRTLGRDRRFARAWQRARGRAARLPREERLVADAPTAPYGRPSLRMMLREAERAYADVLLAEQTSALLGWELPPIDPSLP